MKKILVVMVIAAMAFVLSSSAFASEKASALKLKRGLTNVAFGWTEIPKNIIDTSKQSNGLNGVTIGTLKGVLQTFARTVSGVVDVLTFPIAPTEGPALKPSMVPEDVK